MKAKRHRKTIANCDAGGQPRRILFVITSSDTGGSETMLRELILRLDRSRLMPIVCSLRSCGRVAEEIAVAGTSVFTLGLSDEPGLFDLLRGVVRLARKIDEHDVDLVQSFLYRANFIAPLSARLSSCRPLVVTGHRSLAPLRGRLAVLSACLTQRLTDRAVANSEAVREYLVANEGARRDEVAVIYNGVDTERFHGHDRYAVRTQLGIGSETLVVGAAGRLRPVKGFDHLLRSISSLRGHGLPVVLVLAGEGPERQRLEKLARALQIENRVLFLGLHKDMPALYSAFDIFVLSSLREGFPNVVIEAMASGCPVVATRVGGVPEIVEHERSGLIVPPGSPEGLADALLRLAGDQSLRHTLAAGARRHVETRFELIHTVNAHERLYRDLLNSWNRGPGFGDGNLHGRRTNCARADEYRMLYASYMLHIFMDGFESGDISAGRSRYRRIPLRALTTDSIRCFQADIARCSSKC